MQFNNSNFENHENLWKEECRGAAPPFHYQMARKLADFQFMLEKIDNRLIVRNSGIFLDAIWGSSISGRNFVDLFRNARLKKLDESCQNMLQFTNKVTISTTIGLRFQLLPISADYGGLEFAMGAVNIDKMPEVSLGHLAIENIFSLSLHRKRAEMAYALAEPKADFQYHRPQFQVINGGGAKIGAKTEPILQTINNPKREP